MDKICFGLFQVFLYFNFFPLTGVRPWVENSNFFLFMFETLPYVVLWLCEVKKKSAAMTRSKYPMSASIYSNISAWHQNNQVIFSEILDTETDNKKRHLQYFIVILMPKIKYKHLFPLSSVNYCLKSFYYKTQFWGHV